MITVRHIGTEKYHKISEALRCRSRLKEFLHFSEFVYDHSQSWPLIKNFSPEVIKQSMLNPAEHEILNAHKYKNMMKFSFFASSDKTRIFFSAHKF